MKEAMNHSRRKSWLVFTVLFMVSVAAGGLLSLRAEDVAAAPAALPAGEAYGSEVCATCHADIADEWQHTLHAQAFSSPVFQRDWNNDGHEATCLGCHTSGFNPDTGAYLEEGVTCVACHGQYQDGHPTTPMPITPDAELCSNCHKSTTDEWRASPHGQIHLNCQACHDPHSQTPKAETITALCTNCHNDPGNSFAHGSHASAGLECSNCHMYTAPRTMSPTGGLVATGHTFTVGSDACIACHQDTVHTRDSIVRLTGEVQEAELVTIEELQSQVQDQQAEIETLEARSTVRLYTGLIQGAFIGLVTGGVAAWVVSRRIRIVEENGDGQ